MKKKELKFLGIFLVGLVAISIRVLYSQNEEKSKKIPIEDINATLVNIQGHKEWNESQKDLESKYKEFLELKETIKQPSVTGANISIQEPFRQIPIEYLPIYIEIQHTDPKSEQDTLFVKFIEIYYGQLFYFDINRELKPIGTEIEELTQIKTELEITKDPETRSKLLIRKNELDKIIQESTLIFTAKIPPNSFKEIIPGDILEFPITIYLEHNDKKIIMESKTMAFVGYSLTVESEGD